MSIGSPRPGVAMAGRESLEAYDGALKCMDVAKRSSYKALFLVCLVGRRFWCPCLPPRFLGCLFISNPKRSQNSKDIYIRKSEKG